MEELVCYDCVEVLASGDLSGDKAVGEQCGDEVVGGGGCLPEEDYGGCGDDYIVDGGGEAGRVLVGEGEHGLKLEGFQIWVWVVYARANAYAQRVVSPLNEYLSIWYE